MSKDFGATHVVIGITYGARVILSYEKDFKKTVKEMNDVRLANSGGKSNVSAALQSG